MDRAAHQRHSRGRELADNLGCKGCMLRKRLYGVSGLWHCSASIGSRPQQMRNPHFPWHPETKVLYVLHRHTAAGISCCVIHIIIKNMMVGRVIPVADVLVETVECRWVSIAGDQQGWCHWCGHSLD